MSALVRVAGLGRPVAGRLALAVLTGVAAAGAAVGLAATSAWLIARAAEQPPILYLMLAITGVRAFGVGRGVLRYAERLAAHDAAFRVLRELRTRTYARLVPLSPGGLSDVRSGDLLARLVDDVDSLADLWLRVILPYGAAAVLGAASALLVGALLPSAGLVLAVSLVVVGIAAPAAALVVARRAERRIAPARGELAAGAVDLLAGAPELVALGEAERSVARLRAVDGRLAAAERRSATGAGVGTLVAGLASGAAVWLALLAGIAAVRDGSLGTVALAVVALTPIAVHEVVAPLVPAARHVPGLASAAERVLEVVDRPDPVREPAAAERVAVPPGPLGLRVRDLALRHPGAPTDAVTGFGFEVPHGGRALVTGPSGSGKTTLAAALLRFLEPAGGSIELVGGDATLDTARIPGDEVRRAVGLCEQDPHVFDATIEENVRLARPEATADELAEALHGAQLERWVASLPDGLATPVGEHGARLSGGQRQRIALARALLADVRVLVLDEPTEHLDEPTARAFVADLERAVRGRTVLVLTHRPELFGAGWPVAATLG